MQHGHHELFGESARPGFDFSHELTSVTQEVDMEIDTMDSNRYMDLDTDMDMEIVLIMQYVSIYFILPHLSPETTRASV